MSRKSGFEMRNIGFYNVLHDSIVSDFVFNLINCLLEHKRIKLGRRGVRDE